MDCGFFVAPQRWVDATVWTAETFEKCTTRTVSLYEKARLDAKGNYSHEGADAPLGCRTLADSFNRRFVHKGVMIGKTYVSETIRKHEYEIRVLRKKLKHRKPKPVPINHVWAMDLTGKQDTGGKLHNILGLVEHGSRANLCLHGLRDKASITLLRHLLGAIEKYGKPQFLRTDNEAVFTSRLFQLGLWLLRIRHRARIRGVRG